MAVQRNSHKTLQPGHNRSTLTASLRTHTQSWQPQKSDIHLQLWSGLFINHNFWLTARWKTTKTTLSTLYWWGLEHLLVPSFSVVRNWTCRGFTLCKHSTSDTLFYNPPCTAVFSKYLCMEKRVLPLRLVKRVPPTTRGTVLCSYKQKTVMENRDHTAGLWEATGIERWMLRSGFS